MIRIAECTLSDVPSGVPFHQMIVHQQPHQFGDRERRVRIVQLHRELLRKAIQCLIALQVQPDHVLKRAGYEKILLFQPQFASLRGLVIGVKNLGDIFRLDLVVYRTVIITGIEETEVEGTLSFRFPQPQ